MDYKEEYLKLAKECQTIQELLKKIGCTEQQLIALAIEFVDEKLKRPEFFEEVRRLRYDCKACEPQDNKFINLNDKGECLVCGRMVDKPKHAGGRPSKYKEEFVDVIDEYIKTTGRENTELPTKEGFALFIGVDDDTLDNWAKLHPEFFGALKKLMITQRIQLINDGIYGGKEVNSTIVKLLLQNNHGMREKTDVTTNDKDIPQPIYGAKSTETV